MLSSSLFSSLKESIKGLNSQESGLATIVTIAIIAIAGAIGLGFAASYDWTIILAIFIIAVFGISLVGVLYYKLPFEYAIVVGAICLALVVFIEIGALSAAGLLLIAGGIYYFDRRTEWLIALLICLGVVSVFAGTYFITYNFDWYAFEQAAEQLGILNNLGWWG
jgi:hypothetical protein